MGDEGDTDAMIPGRELAIPEIAAEDPDAVALARDVIPPEPPTGKRRIRPVSQLSLHRLEMKPAVGDAPTVEWVDPTTLLVDEGYQRHLSERSIRLISKIIAGWDWRRFKPPIVARTPDGLEVIDGQHVAIGAASRPDVGLIPVMVNAGVEKEARASAFIGHNRDRLGITPTQMHAAAAAAGDEDAITLDQVCARAGVVVLRNQPGNSLFKPGETIAVSAIGALINRHGALGARRVLEVLANAGRAPITARGIKAVELLLYDTEYKGEIDGPDITTAIMSLGAEAERDAAVFAAAHNVPIWRALAVVLFRKGKRRGRRSAV
jgi:hypothetical protein